MEGGQGPYLYSVDKRDLHSNHTIAEAVRSDLSTGFSLSSVTHKECHLGERIKIRFPSMERVRFCNSGTEASTYALATAMEFTGRTKVSEESAEGYFRSLILVFDNGHHGVTPNFGSGDNKLNVSHSFILGTYNQIEANQKHISSDLAAIIVEPMLLAGGQIPATREFLSFLRKTADVTGAVLIFDEAMTSHLHINGLQGFHKIMPDMTTLGKYIGWGLPSGAFGAFGGRSDIMAAHEQRAQKLGHSGTFNNNVLTVSAALAAADLVTEDVIHRVNKLGDTIRNRISEICAEHHFSDLKITGLGSTIGLQFLRVDRELLMGLLFCHMVQHGIWIGRRGFFF
ncbi:hypothetical protein LB506_000627, partial [Fusarium annulatum]